MATAPLTWQNVAAPDFRGSMEGLRIASGALDRGLGGFADAIGKFNDQRKDMALAAILNDTSALQDPLAIRAAIGAADKGALGSAQFAALDNMLSGRIKQAGDIEANRSAAVLNPINEKMAGAKFDDFVLRAPLERDQIVANTGLTRANTGLVGANTERVKLGNEFERSVQPGRIAATNSGNDLAVFNNQNARQDYLDSQMAVQLAADIRGRVGPNAGADAERLLEDIRQSHSPAVYARVQGLLNQTTGAYNTAPGSVPGSTGSRSGPATGQSQPSAPVPSVDRLVPFTGPGAENDPANATNERLSSASDAGARAQRFIQNSDISTSARAISAGLADTTSSVDQVSRALNEKGSSFGEVNSRVLDVAIEKVMQHAQGMGISLTPRAAGEILRRSYTFGNSVFPELQTLGLDPSKNGLRLDYNRLNKNLEMLKPGSDGNSVVSAQSRAANDVANSYQRVQETSAQAAAAAKLYQDALRQAQNRRVENLDSYRRDAEEKGKRADAALEKFKQDNPQLYPSTPRVPPGTTPAPAEILSRTTRPEPSPAARSNPALARAEQSFNAATAALAEHMKMEPSDIRQRFAWSQRKGRLEKELTAARREMQHLQR